MCSATWAKGISMHTISRYLIGPFSQIITLEGLPSAGPIDDSQLQIIHQGGLIISHGVIEEVASFDDLRHRAPLVSAIEHPAVALPAYVDSHTHICFAGSRAKDYALRLAGKDYQEIAAAGGGILDSVKATRACSKEDLFALTLERMKIHMQEGVATCEIKSGYGLSVEDELKQLQVIRMLANATPMSLIPTCLAAHCRPPEVSDNKTYLKLIVDELFPALLRDALTNRIDIFVEKSAFTLEEAAWYITEAKKHGFAVSVHADQFTRGSALLAAQMGASSADHLEVSEKEDFLALRDAHVFPIVLPGASLGLGLPFAKAREMLDCGLPLVIASDWNPGSAPMGNLLAQAALLGISQRLSMAETFAALTYRAAGALGLSDRGILAKGMRADIVAYPCADYREILYHQGSLKPMTTWIGGGCAPF
jgi:imidazolonepropionase